jgi:hypothetical protein
VLQPSPLKQNLIPRFEKRKDSKRDNEQLHVPSLRQLEIRMARTEKIFTLLCCFFYHLVAPLDLIELDRLAPCDMTLLVQDLHRMFGICQICFEWCPLLAIQHPRVPSNTSLTEIHGRCRELLPMAVVNPACMSPFHTVTR